MNIVSYEPWSMLKRINEELGRAFDEGNLGRVGERDSSNIVTSQWAPAVDIRVEPERFVLTADVPGVEPKDIEITMDNGMLVIRGQRKLEDEAKSNGYRRVERVYGSFYRRFSLPDTVDPEGIRAAGRNGVLEVVIPKQEKVQPRRIAVTS